MAADVAAGIVANPSLVGPGPKHSPGTMTDETKAAIAATAWAIVQEIDALP